MYDAIEGIKGSGKTTVFEELRAQLVRLRGGPVPTLRPTAGIQGCPVDGLHARCGRWWPDALVERLYARRSNRAAARVSRRDGIVLGERSILTSYVCRWDLQDPERGLRRVDALEHRIALPDHVFYLAVPVAVARARIARRPARGYGVHDETEARLVHLDALYRHLAWHGARYGLGRIQWHWIDGTRAAPCVARQIARRILALEGQGSGLASDARAPWQRPGAEPR